MRMMHIVAVTGAIGGLTAVLFGVLLAPVMARETSSGTPLVEPPAPGDLNMQFTLTSPVFTEGEAIPRKYTVDGADVSPPLAWQHPPRQTRSLALICDDPDAPMGVWVHWVLYSIPADADILPEAVPPKRELPNGARQGLNDFKNIGYNGPAPPPGPAHRYVFTLYALDAPLTLAPGARKADVLQAMEGHVLAEAVLTGLYQR